jgi:hypothetical protein
MDVDLGERRCDRSPPRRDDDQTLRCQEVTASRTGVILTPSDTASLTGTRLSPGASSRCKILARSRSWICRESRRTSTRLAGRHESSILDEDVNLPELVDGSRDNSLAVLGSSDGPC